MKWISFNPLRHSPWEAMLEKKLEAMATGNRRDRGATLRLGGGAPLVTQYWGGGAQNTFSYQFFIIFKILGGTSPPPAAPPTPRSLNRLVPGVHYSCLCLVATESDLKPEKIKSSSLDIFGFKFLFHD